MASIQMLVACLFVMEWTGCFVILEIGSVLPCHVLGSVRRELDRAQLEGGCG